MPEATAAQPGTHRSFTLADAVALSLAAFLMIIVLAASWARWLDPILDSGRDLYIPEKLVQGKLLYRDFQYYYPPVAPYLLALGTLLVGSNLSGYVLIGCATGLIAAFGLYSLVRELAGTAAAAAAVSMFVTLSLTAASNWGSNFILPYAHAATIGMTFVILYLLFMSRYLFRTGNGGDFAFAVAFGILAAGSKLEFATFFATSLTYVVLIHRPGKKLVVSAVAAILASFLAAWAVFGNAGRGHHWLWDNILLLTTQRRSVAFYSAVQGSDHVWSNLLKSAHGAALVLVLIGLLAAISQADRRIRGSRRLLAKGAIAIAIAALSVYGSDYIFFRGWSLLQLALIPFAIRRPRSPLPFLLIASMLCSLRIFLNLSPAWYGFSLIVPVYALVVYVLFEMLPSHGVYSRRLALAWLPLLALLMFRAQLHQREIWSHCVYPVETVRGTYLDWNPDRAAIVQDFVRSARGARSLVVIPESPTLNYFTKVDNPLPYQMFTPFISDSEWLERDMISAFERERPQLVAFVSRPVDEFGYRGFGVDYNLRLAAYIRSNYRVAQAWRRPGFSLVVAKRVDD